MQRWMIAALGIWMLAAPLEAAEKEPSKAKLGEKISGLSFLDDKGNSVSLDALRGKKATVVVFLSFECPVSNSYSQPLADMAKEYGKHGVSFIGFSTNQEETRSQLAKYRKDFDLNFPVYLDTDYKAANALAADVTPEAFVLDAEGVLRYRGRIDSTWSDRLKKHNNAVRQDLKQVIGEVLSGRPIATSATAAIGCAIDREAKVTAKDGPVTYYRDVLPILQARCQSCHRPGESGPFSLLTYKQAVNWADDIKEYTKNRLMPPFKVAEGIAFHNDRRMTDQEIATLAAWVDGGTPIGDVKQAPPERKFIEGWQLGQPDLILTPSSDFVLGPNGKDLFRCFVMPTNLPEDVYVTAVEVRPANPRVVHHALLFIDTTGQGRKLEQSAQANDKKAEKDHAGEEPRFDVGPGYTVSMGVGFLPQGGLLGWAPGQMPRYLPENSGIKLPKNSDIVMQVHYHRDGRAEKDRTQVGLYFSKKPIEKNFAGGIIAGRSGEGILGGRFFIIPAGDEKFKLEGDTWATKDFTLYTIMPHMHMLGKSIKVTLTPLGGSEKTLLSIPAWDYNWQETYALKESMLIKEGSKLHVEAIYDNSSKNPMNPSNPPKRVTFGEQTFNEMCFVFLGGSSPHSATIGRGRSLPLTLLTNKK
jgi:peroxiredoxin/mono/diheme cytochrome c family protein